MRSGWAIPYASLLGQVCSLEARSSNLRHFRAFSTPEHAAAANANRPAFVNISQWYSE